MARAWDEGKHPRRKDGKFDKKSVLSRLIAEASAPSVPNPPAQASPKTPKASKVGSKPSSASIDNAIRAAAGRGSAPSRADLKAAAKERETAAMNRLLDLDDPTSADSLKDALLNGEGSPTEREAWADAVTRFDKRATAGLKMSSHLKWVNSLHEADDPVAVTRERLSKLKAENLRAAAIVALKKELAGREAAKGGDTRAPGMQHGLRHTDNAEGVAWADEHLPLPELTEDEAQSVMDYTAGWEDGYLLINKGLRGDLPTSPKLQEAFDRHVRNIDSAFAKSELKEPITVHRATDEGFSRLIGVDPGDIEGMHQLVGKEFTEKGYLSTSIGQKADFNGPVFLMFRVPKGHKALNVMSVSSYGPAEREILLDRDTKFVVHGVTGKRNESSGKQEWFIEAEVVPKDWEKPAGWHPDPYDDMLQAYGREG